MNNKLEKLILYKAKIIDAMTTGPRSDKQIKRAISYKAFLMKELADVSRKIEASKLENIK